DPRLLTGVLLESPLHDRFHVRLGHGLADLPVHEVPAVSIEQRAEVEEGSRDIDVRDIDVPVLVGPQRLHETRPLLRRRQPTSIEAPRVPEHAVGTGGTDGDDIIVEHHERQPPIAFQRMAVLVVQDDLFLPALQPRVAGDLSIVLVDLPVPLLPSMELAGPERQPAEEPAGRQLGPHGPVVDVIDDLVAGVMGNPASFQSSPLAFFARTFSSMSSAMTSFFCTSLASRCSIRPSVARVASRLPEERSKARSACSRTCLTHKWIMLG